MVNHTKDATSTAKIQRVDLGDLSLEIAEETDGYLRWGKGAMILFASTVSSDVPLIVTVGMYHTTRVLFTLREGSWTIKMPIDISPKRVGRVTTSMWLISVDPIKFTPLQRSSTSDVM